VRRATAFLVAASLLSGCGTRLVYETEPHATRTLYRLTEKKTTCWLVIRSHAIQAETAKLPPEEFSEARTKNLGCWRFRTRDGTTWGTNRYAIETVVGSYLILTDFRHLDKEPVAVRDLERLVSQRDFPVEIQHRIVGTKEIRRKNHSLILLDSAGAEHRLSIADAEYQSGPADASYFVYGLDGEGRAYHLDRGEMINAFLKGKAMSIRARRYGAVPIASISEWEFDQDRSFWFWTYTTPFRTLDALISLVTLSDPAKLDGRCWR
jgi:hypothetical protein